MTQDICAFIGTPEDKAHLPAIKHMFNGLTTFVMCEPITLLIQLEMYCAKRQINKIVSTNTAILSKLLALTRASMSRLIPVSSDNRHG